MERLTATNTWHTLKVRSAAISKIVYRHTVAWACCLGRHAVFSPSSYGEGRSPARSEPSPARTAQPHTGSLPPCPTPKADSHSHRKRNFPEVSEPNSYTHRHVTRPWCCTSCFSRTFTRISQATAGNQTAQQVQSERTTERSYQPEARTRCYVGFTPQGRPISPFQHTSWVADACGHHVLYGVAWVWCSRTKPQKAGST